MKPIWQTPPVQDSLLGIGMVPPAMNLALSPETAVTVGSASTCATPCRSKAWMVALKVVSPRAQASVASVADSAPLMANGLSILRLPLGPLPLMLTPSCLTMSRRISATVTLRLTWSSPRMMSELITRPVASAGPFSPPPPWLAPEPETEIEGSAPRRGLRVVDEAVGDIDRLLGFDGGRDRAGEDDRVRDGADVDVVAGDRGVEQADEFDHVAADRDLEDRDLPAVAGEREDRRLAVGERRNIDAARRAHDRIGDARVADVDLGRILGQIDDDGLADAELEVSAEPAAGDVRRRRAVRLGRFEAAARWRKARP